MAGQMEVPVIQTKQVVQFVIDRLTEALASGRRIEFRGFGVFAPQIRKSKVGRNPKHPEAGTCNIPARKVVRFRVGRELNEKLNPSA